MKQNLVETFYSVSVIIPCYRVEPYLERCIQSVISQSLKEIEIILIDDGSPDNVPEICDKWAKIDSRIKVIHKYNAGLGYARNSGLEIATGEYVAFVDADDYIDENMYMTLHKEAIINNADVVFCGFQTETKPQLWKKSSEVKERTVWDKNGIWQFMLDMIASKPHESIERKYQMSVWHAIYRRSLIDKFKIKFVSERDYVSEDLPFHIDFLTKSNKVIYLPQNYYFYCLNETSLTSRFLPEKYERFRNLREFLLQKLGENKEVILRVDRFFIGYTRSHLQTLQSSQHTGKNIIIRKIVNDPLWAVLKYEYPPNNLPIYPRLIYFLIIHKQIWCLQIVSKIISRLKYIIGKR